jgi:hypothetical protein
MPGSAIVSSLGFINQKDNLVFDPYFLNGQTFRQVGKDQIAMSLLQAMGAGEVSSGQGDGQFFNLQSTPEDTVASGLTLFETVRLFEEKREISGAFWRVGKDVPVFSQGC